MKARLLQFKDSLQLLTCTGKIIMFSYADAYDFLSNFDDPEYYAGDEVWNYGELTMESYRGTTIAIVSDEGKLIVENGDLLRTILNNRELKYLTVVEYAALHGKQDSIIRRFCRGGRIPGAIQKGKSWLIPENAPYPPDERVRK